MTVKKLSERQAELMAKPELSEDEIAELYAIDAMLDARCE